MTWFDFIFDWVDNTFKTIEKASFSERIFGLFLFLESMQNKKIEFKLMQLSHIWPLYHNKTQFDYYKMVIPPEVANQTK